jgi:uncharacterized membrane protein
VSFAAITLCVVSQRVFIVAVVYFVVDSVWKILDTPSYYQHSVCDLLHDRLVVPSGKLPHDINPVIF